MTDSDQVPAGKLPPWQLADLPAPPGRRLGEVFRTIGPGAIMLAASIGGGEWLMGPTVTVKYGLSLMSIAVVAVFLQTQLNLELVRYTLYSGEPIFTGFMRTRPGPYFWGSIYAFFTWLGTGWPNMAGLAAGALAAGILGQLPNDEQDRGLVALLGSLVYLACGIILLAGRKIERTLEGLSWFMVSWVLIYMAITVVIFVPLSIWGQAIRGLVLFEWMRGGESEGGIDWFLIAAFAASSGAGGVSNAVLTNWYRDKGFGMGAVVGYIPTLFAGREVKLANTGKVFPLTPENRKKWKLWFWFAKLDQYGIFLAGGIASMFLPCVLAVQVLPAGKDLRGLAVAAEVANGLSALGGPAFWFLTLICGFWILFSTSLTGVDTFVRVTTDLLWSGSARVRRWRGGDIRWVYYALLGGNMVWGVIALQLAPPIFLFQISANISAAFMILLCMHALHVNRTLLPPELRPPLWRQVTLVLCAAFYGTFAFLSVRQMLG